MGRRIVTRGDIVITVVTAVAWSVALFGGVGYDCRAATFRGLGFPGPGPDSRGTAVSADGSVVAGDSLGFPWSPRAHRWVTTNPPAESGPAASWTFGLSADGNVVAGTHTPGTGGGDRAFRWVGGVSTALPLLAGSNASSGNGYGISGDGNTVVGIDVIPPHSAAIPWRWTAATGTVPLGTLDSRGNARDANYDGSVIVGRVQTPRGQEAFRWTAQSGMVGLGDLYMDDNLFSLATAVSASGHAIVGQASPASGFSGQEAFLWTEAGGMIGLGDLPGGLFHSGATGVSDDGSIVVGNGDNGINSAAFIWDRVHGMRDLRSVLVDAGVDLTGWYLRSAMGISGDGTTIVGDGFRGDRVEGWVAVIPEPGGIVTTSSLAALIAVRRRPRR